ITRLSRVDGKPVPVPAGAVNDSAPVFGSDGKGYQVVRTKGASQLLRLEDGKVASDGQKWGPVSSVISGSRGSVYYYVVSAEGASREDIIRLSDQRKIGSVSQY